MSPTPSEAHLACNETPHLHRDSKAPWLDYERWIAEHPTLAREAGSRPFDDKSFEEYLQDFVQKLEQHESE